MKKLLLILLFLDAGKIFAQKITSLDFPYHKNYVLQPSGIQTMFSFYTQTDSAKDCYEIKEENISTEADTTNFSAIFIVGKDSAAFARSKLWINAKAMFFIVYKNSTCITQAIALPLYKGKKWKTKINGDNTKCECTSTDTLIKTPAGHFHCFCIKSIEDFNVKKIRLRIRME